MTSAFHSFIWGQTNLSCQQSSDISCIPLAPHNALFIVYDTILSDKNFYYGRIITPHASYCAPIIGHIELSELLKRNGRIYSNETIGEYKPLFNNIIHIFESSLHEGDTIYALLEGKFANVAIEAIPLESADTYLFDLYQIRRISSVKGLMKNTQRIDRDKYTTILFGDISYNSETLQDLQGSKRAITYLNELFSTNHLSPIIYSQSNATTQEFSGVSSQQVDNVLLSTHGDIIESEDSIKRYSLAFYNAEWVDSRQISEMDLSGIQTILITACRSGQYNDQQEQSLQTMLKMAHANTIILHIWKTNDSMAEYFIKTYYTEWLSGKTPFDAFNATKTSLRRHFLAPYYWAGFIMLD